MLGLLGASSFAAAASPATPERPIEKAHRESDFLKNLLVYLARWEREWSQIPEDEDRNGEVLSTKRLQGISFGRSEGVRPVRSDSVPHAWIGPCTEEVYRRFFIGGDTITFTLGRVPEGCNESPRMIWRRGFGEQHRVVMKPLYDWNVDALWLTPHYLIFGLTASYEGSDLQFARVACWQLDTGRWFTSPKRGWLLHRPGFDLSSFLPDWYSARAYEVGSSVVLRGRKNALALWPEEGSWALLYSANGQPIMPPIRRVPRTLLEAAEKSVPPKVKAQIRAVLARIHGKADRDVVEFNILEVMKAPCSSYAADYAVLARAVAQDRATGGPQLDLSRELFGVFLVNSSLTRVTNSFAPFPSERWGDYAAYFDLDAPNDSIAVWAEGATYGDEEARHAYPCAH